MVKAYGFVDVHSLAHTTGILLMVSAAVIDQSIVNLSMREWGKERQNELVHCTHKTQLFYNTFLHNKQTQMIKF